MNIGTGAPATPLIYSFNSSWGAAPCWAWGKHRARTRQMWDFPQGAYGIVTVGTLSHHKPHGQSHSSFLSLCSSFLKGAHHYPHLPGRCAAQRRQSTKTLPGWQMRTVFSKLKAGSQEQVARNLVSYKQFFYKRNKNIICIIGNKGVISVKLLP